MHIKEIHLLTDDLEGTEGFYVTNLDAVISAKDEQSLTLMMGGTKLVFKRSEGLRPYYHIAFDIPNNQMQEAFAWVKKKLQILSVTANSAIADFKAWNAKSFYFYDNNGTILEFICRFDANNQSSKAFTGRSVLYASEIGIVSPDVPHLADEITKRFGLEIFEKQPRDDEFTVIGQATGLFILSSDDRNWYPTDKKAKTFYTKIVFEYHGRIQELEISNRE